MSIMHLRKFAVIAAIALSGCGQDRHGCPETDWQSEFSENIRFYGFAFNRGKTVPSLEFPELGQLRRLSTAIRCALAEDIFPSGQFPYDNTVLVALDNRGELRERDFWAIVLASIHKKPLFILDIDSPEARDLAIVDLLESIDTDDRIPQVDSID